MKIESTVVFGTLAVQHYKETGDTSVIENSCDGIVCKRIFASEAEYEAYCLGINDNTDWYAHEIIEPVITKAILSKKELAVFLYPAEKFDRNATDEEILEDYCWEDPSVEKYTPDEFAALVNDGSFPNNNMYIRFIEY